MARVKIADTIIAKDNKILLTIRNFDPGRGKLDLPGGFVDQGETPKQTAAREAKEETGLDVELVYKLGTFNYFDRQPKTSHAYVGKITGGKITKSVEGEPVWIDIEKIKAEDLSFPTQFLPILEAFKKYLKGK